MPVFSTYCVNNNGELICHVKELYLKKNDKIADITYGKGVFWKYIDMSQYAFYKSDILTCPKTPYDFRSLPYENEFFDVVVFDPPYAHNPGNMMVNNTYKNKETTKGMYHKDIINLYEEGMRESFRILKTGGVLFVKNKDEIESSFQRWGHIEIYNIAIKIGFYGKDLFIFHQKNNPHIQFAQQHARKNHSYLWIFKKWCKQELAQLKKFGIVSLEGEAFGSHRR